MARPVRSAFEEVTSSIPNGPLGIAGDGDLVGFTGVAAVSLVRGLVPGDELDPGYRVQSHEIRDETHTFRIDAYSRDIAEAVARLRAAPSSADFFIRQTKVTGTTVEVTERSTVSTWQVTVEVTNRELMQ